MIVKPCKVLCFCPYGPLVEQFDLAEVDDPCECAIFGHICPVFKVAEPMGEAPIEDFEDVIDAVNESVNDLSVKFFNV